MSEDQPQRFAQGVTTETDDREWFEANPDRNYRLRDYIEGETPIPLKAKPGEKIAVAVRQIKPGMRQRSVLRLRADADIHLPSEQLAQAAFECLDQGFLAFGPDVSEGERQLANMLAPSLHSCSTTF